MHAAVETQLAGSDPAEATQPLHRLTGAGLSRHDAVHAIASVFADFIFPILKAPHAPPEFDAAGYCRALADLTVSAWLGIGKR